MGPETFWQSFFLAGHRAGRRCGGRSSGPLVAIVSFVCSIGNVPLAAVLWNGGISFGGVIAFIFADLIILPILNIYRKYYGTRDDADHAGHLLRRDGRRRVPGRIALRRNKSHPDQRNATVMQAEHLVELHHLAQHRLPGYRGIAGDAVLHLGRTSRWSRMMGGDPPEAGDDHSHHH